MRKLFIVFICVLALCVLFAFWIEQMGTGQAAEEPQPAAPSYADAPVIPALPLPPDEPVIEEEPMPIEEEPMPEPDEPPVLNTLRLSAVGDLMLHSPQYENAYNHETGEYDFNPCFEAIAPYLQQADITMGNLETVFSGLAYSDYPMFSAPDEFGTALKNAGFDILTTANNHSLDKQESGLLRTRSFLDELGIAATGTARSQEERDEILIIEQNGIKLAIVSYTYGTNGIPIPRGKDYLVNTLDEALIKADLERAKALEPDFIIVSPHMGDEYNTKPSNRWRDMVKFMFENGADIVLAHHPHVIQPFEIIEITDEEEPRFCVVAYSMGNFVSGQRTIPRDEGVIINIEFNKLGNEKAYINKISFIPTWVMYGNTNGAREIKILPIGEVLQKKDGGLTAHTSPVDSILPRIRPMDITRMRTALDNIKNQLLGEDTAQLIEDIYVEYIIYEHIQDLFQ